MSRFYKYQPAIGEYTTLRFVDDGTLDCKIKHFDTHCLVADGTSEQLQAMVDLQATEISLTEIEFKEFFALASKSNQATFEKKTLERKLEEDIANITQNASNIEMLSWTTQAELARKCIASNGDDAEALNQLVTARGKGETALELSAKIMASSAAYETALLATLGAHQRQIKAIYTNAEETDV